MKKLTYFFAFCLSFQYSQSQTVVTKTRTSPNNNNDYLHRVANEFSNEVGDKLKELYPAKLKKVSVKLEVINGMLSLTYTAQIIKCSEQEAQYYFDHRGSLSADVKSLYALNNAKSRTEEQKTEVVSVFQKVYGNVIVVSQNTDQVQYKGYYWVIYESFIAAVK